MAAVSTMKLGTLDVTPVNHTVLYEAGGDELVGLRLRPIRMRLPRLICYCSCDVPIVQAARELVKHLNALTGRSFTGWWHVVPLSLPAAHVSRASCC